MQVDIFDVAHGACALITAENGRRALVDCGDDVPRFSPSQHLLSLGCTSIEALFISNFDQDHVSGICGVLDRIQVKALYRNKSVPMDWLVREKQSLGGLTAAMARTVSMANDYNQPLASPPDLGTLNFGVYYATHPTFLDTNNLSLVSFFSSDGVTIAFTGDLECAGWKHLLQNADFRHWLALTNIFVASHHGRISGYCEEVFNFAKPDIIVISDKGICHDTQDNCYARHASGVPWNGGERRYCLTTRNDGHIRVQKRAGSGSYHITATR